MPTVLIDQTEANCPSARANGTDLWIDGPEMQALTGWVLKPEGLCKGSICVPVPPGRRAEFAEGAAVNAAAFWRHMGSAIAHDAAGETWVLGASALDRSSRLLSLDAPDFSLPDLGGREVSLGEHRGKKVLLATWASW